jgi:hypothetical protein
VNEIAFLRGKKTLKIFFLSLKWTWIFWIRNFQQIHTHHSLRFNHLCKVVWYIVDNTARRNCYLGINETRARNSVWKRKCEKHSDKGWWIPKWLWQFESLCLLEDFHFSTCSSLQRSAHKFVAEILKWYKPV